MVKKKKKKTRKPAAARKAVTPKKSIAPPKCRYDELMLDSDFLKALYEQFFDRNAKPKWPGPPPATRPARALHEIPEALTALLTERINGTSLPQAQPGTAPHLVSEAARITGWPGPGSKVPANWQGDMATYRMFEVAWAVNFMVQAYTLTGGGGGGPDDWPSGGHHP